ncbi:MAG: sigma-70 family RNA polymerase sigma factor, partial [Pseudomonadota bacterium]
MAAETDLRRRIETERAYLVRFAAVHLRNADAVEDAVQETLLAALAGADSFAGRSNLRTWLTGILKHKIIDAMRRAGREATLPDAPEGDGSEFDALFEQNGHWVAHPEAWTDPDAALEQKQFFAVLEECLAKLPPRAARAFMMREHLGSGTDEICRELGVSS